MSEESRVELCRYLRWKGRSQEGDTFEELRRAVAQNRVPYTCLITCRPWGLDDGPAVPERCTPSRACFAPAREPRRPFSTDSSRQTSALNRAFASPRARRGRRRNGDA